MKKLAIITTHPIQYYAPVFELLAKEVELKIFYTGGHDFNLVDCGFKKEITWDIPLLTGYNFEFLQNVSPQPGSHHFKGIINPDAIKQISAFYPDAILVYGWANQSHLKIIRHFKGRIPVYFRGDSTLLDKQGNIKSLFKKIFLRWVYSHIDTTFYVGSASKAYFKHFGLKEEQLVFAPHAIDNERFKEDRRMEASLLRDKLSIAPDEILILFAGKLEPKKNPKLLLDAFLDLDLKNTHLLFVGNGVLEEGLVEKGSFDSAQDDNGGSLELGAESWEGKINEKSFDYTQDDNEGSSELGVESWEGKINEKSFDYAQDDNDGSLEFRVESWEERVKKRIHFMDFQNQKVMPVVYQACDLFCLPSQGPGETWGLAVNEAMAAGKAVLVSDKVGCAVDLVKAGVNGAVFKSGDLADLKQKLNVLTENIDKLAQMGLASQEVIKDWSFEKQVAVIIDTIKNKHAK